jgi:hypothetical protein
MPAGPPPTMQQARRSVSKLSVDGGAITMRKQNLEHTLRKSKLSVLPTLFFGRSREEGRREKKFNASGVPLR